MGFARGFASQTRYLWYGHSSEAKKGTISGSNMVTRQTVPAAVPLDEVWRNALGKFWVKGLQSLHWTSFGGRIFAKTIPLDNFWEEKGFCIFFPLDTF